MESWLIGSAADCDIVVDEATVSGRHCRLTLDEGGYRLEDLGSTNGTFVSGRKITEPTPVSRDDQVTLGQTFLLPWPAESSAPAAAAPPRASNLPTYLAVATAAALAGVLGWYFLGREVAENGDPGAAPPGQQAGEQTRREGGDGVGGGVGGGDDATPPQLAPVARRGFEFSPFEPNEIIKHIKVQLTVGEGAELTEPVDLHLGLGFPLRLYPVGTISRQPSFAAFPQISAMPDETQTVGPGQFASFDFFADDLKDAQDKLGSTPQLLADVRLRDIQSIGFACAGETDWRLTGYRIEINEKPFASHDSLDLNPRAVQAENRRQLESLLNEAVPLAERIANAETLASSQLSEEAPAADLRQDQAALDKMEAPIRRLRGIVEGGYPWYVEEDPSFQPAPLRDEQLATSVTVKLMTRGGPAAGSQNPLYLKAGGHKYLLTSEFDPLPSEPRLQEFVIEEDALKVHPVSLADLTPAQLGIGMVGNDLPYDFVPDRAELQRVVLEANRQPLYDSEKSSTDRDVLARISLIPPGHRTGAGVEQRNPQTAREIYLWRPNMKIETDSGSEEELEPERPESSDGDGSDGPPNPPKDNKTTPSSTPGPTLPQTRPTPPQSRPTLLLLGRAPPFYSRRPIPLPRLVIQLRVPVTGVRLIPSPTRPNISNVRVVDAGSGFIQFGAPCRVTWQLAGNPANVGGFRVRLYPALPHAAYNAALELTAVANAQAPRNARQITLTPDLTTILARLPSPASAGRLFLRPEVTAVDSAGNVIAGAANRGPLLPVFPGGPQTPVRLTRIQLGPSPLAPPAPTPFPLAPSAQFAIQNGAWLWSPIGGSDIPGAGPAAWSLNAVSVAQRTHNARFSFDAHKSAPGFANFAHNTAIHPPHPPALTRAAALQFSAANVPLSAASRLVAHVGFINDLSGVNTVNIQAGVFIYGAAALQRSVQTSLKIPYSKAGRPPLQLIDIPLGGVPPAPYVATPPGAPLPSTGNVVVVFVFDWSSAVTPRRNPLTLQRESIGLFGVRLVP